MKERLGQNENPYIEMPLWVRMMCVFFVFVFFMLSPLFKTIINGSEYPFTYSRLAVDLIFFGLMIVPIIFYKKGEFGYLHPLIFFPMFTIFMFSLKNLDAIIGAFDTAPYYSSIKVKALEGWSQRQLAKVDLEYRALRALSKVFYFVGYFMIKNIKVPKFELLDPKGLKSKMLFMVLFSIALFLLFTQSRGGITAHILSFGKGRATSMEGVGWVVAIVRVGTIAQYMWYIYDKRAIKNPFFIAFLLLIIPINFFISGARSDVAIIIMFFLLIWIYHNKRVPIVSLFVIAYVGMIGMGIMGQFRQSTYKRQVDWSVFSDVNMTNAKDSFTKETGHRNQEQPALAVIGRGVDELGFLYGKTYLSAMFFFIPRAIWTEKPHSAGFYCGTQLYNSVGAVPPGFVAEAFWNFHIFGVMLFGAILGYVHRWAGELYYGNRLVPFAYLIYITSIVMFQGGGQSAVFFIQRIALILLGVWWLKMFKTIKHK